MAEDEEIYLDAQKTRRYISGDRSTEKEFEKSLTDMLDQNNFSNMSILDAGCAAGGLYEVLRARYSDIQYTGIDLDHKCIDFATRTYPNADFMVGSFLDNKFKDASFDVVILWGWSYMVPHWKTLFLEATRIASRHIVFENRLRFSGPTVVDIDLSYQYYYLTEKRNHYIVHNYYELLAFLQIAEHGLKEIKCNAFLMPQPTSAILPLALSEVNVGVFVLRKMSELEIASCRRIGVSEEAANNVAIDISLSIEKEKI